MINFHGNNTPIRVLLVFLFSLSLLSLLICTHYYLLFLFSFCGKKDYQHSTSPYITVSRPTTTTTKTPKEKYIHFAYPKKKKKRFSVEKKEKHKKLLDFEAKQKEWKEKKITHKRKICIKNMNFCEKKKERRKINFCCMFIHTFLCSSSTQESIHKRTNYSKVSA